MAKTTKIPWATSTWNPFMGCTPASEGCANCYARRFWNLHGIKKGEVRRTSDRTFRSILSTTKYPPGSRVFVCSISDFFHEAVPESWRELAHLQMRLRRDLTFLLLTKRPKRIEGRLRMAVDTDPDLYRHIWLGVTAENQARADERIPDLVEINWPGKKFVSIEPQLGLVDLSQWLEPCEGCGNRGSHAWAHEEAGSSLCRDACDKIDNLPLIDWVIEGGESGPKARPFDLDWARSLRDECVEAGVPYFFKQSSGLHPEKMPLLDGKQWAEIPTDG